jgi:hypothetical protein
MYILPTINNGDIYSKIFVEEKPVDNLMVKPPP